MDPFGHLTSRHRVYELLVDESNHTAPGSNAIRGQSLIPWNQNNDGFLKTVGGKLWCGSLVKIVLVRYMGWNGAEPKGHPVKNNNGFDAANWTIGKLRQRIPVRAWVGGHHYVGIVGHRCVPDPPLPTGIQGPVNCSNEFLCIEPWAFGVNAIDSITYAGATTGFLGIIKQSGTTWSYNGETISSVEQ
ncbi:MAG: hypothetical protein HC846_02020 [Blastocatellia bacterium]|nr:hypothetical protein [Blastocatellia bacterium]